MKIISLLPIKDEAWILEFCLTNLSAISDEILILDDHSTDESIEIAKNFPKAIVMTYEDGDTLVNMSKRRNFLLEQGRKRGGTHFVMLDADECFSDNFVKNFKQEIEKLSPRESLGLPWKLTYLENSLAVADKNGTIKDFIFCDDGVSTYENKVLSENRTPCKDLKVAEGNDYAVYHFQNFSVKRNQLKQIWYRCNELIEGKISAQKINARYDFTKNLKPQNSVPLLDKEISKTLYLINQAGSADHLLKRIQKLFDKYGVGHFEPLDIWFLDETQNIFRQKLKRQPKIKTFPKIIVKINNIKNKIKNMVN